MMKRGKLTRRMLFLLVFFICIVVLLIFAASKLRMPSPSELIFKFIMLGNFIIQMPPPMPPPPDVFRQHILSPIPESVANIKADEPIIGGYRYTLRFNISRADLALLIDSRPFVRVWNVKYRDGYLSWDWDRDGPLGMSKYESFMTVYNPERWHHEPRWFTPELGANTEVYAFAKAGNRINVETFEYKSDAYDRDDRVSIKVLIYNEKEGEAYFIVFR